MPADGTRNALLGVTLDPDVDTPEVLRAYGESALKGEKRFEQWTLATGTSTQIGDVARYFGVDFRAESGFVTHTLMTAVMGADGRVVRTFPSNSWLPETVLEVVRSMPRLP
jgi:protein SCO1/2